MNPMTAAQISSYSPKSPMGDNDFVLHAGDVFEYVLDDPSRVAEAQWPDDSYSIDWRDGNGHDRREWSEPDYHLRGYRGLAHPMETKIMAMTTL